MDKPTDLIMPNASGAEASAAAKTGLEEMSKDELVQRLARLQEELELSRALAVMPDYANEATLHWRGRERFLNEKGAIVQLKPIKSHSFQPEKGDHRIIEGDNLIVMYSLLPEFRGGATKGFDVIYMDPPYNTGEDTFAYTDDYNLSKDKAADILYKHGRPEALVSLDDPKRHTKWINHMAPRLWVAKKLLKSTGIIIVSIDEHELPRLWLLMEEIFGDKNRIATLVWERSRKNDANYVSEGHEYMLVWARSKQDLDTLRGRLGKWRHKKPGLDMLMDTFRGLLELHGDDYETIHKELKAFVSDALKAVPPKARKQSPLWTIRQYIHVDDKCRDLGPYKEEDPSWPGGGGPNYDVYHPDTKRAVRTPPKGWVIGTPEAFQNLVKDDRVVWKKLDQGTPKIKKYLLEGRETDVMTSVIAQDARRTVMEAKALFGVKKAPDNPKDRRMLADLFNLVTWQNKEALILDPYAGSGTTGHAVIAMNAEDQGKRRFVMIENGNPSPKARVPRKEYTLEVTAERIRRAITGVWADGKAHPSYDTGFHYYRASGEITKRDIMASTKEQLADIILQVVEDDSNRVDCRVEDHRYIIGKTRLGFGIALVWGSIKGKEVEKVLTWDVLNEILDEADVAGVKQPLHIYATGNTAPLSDDLYRFHQIPNAMIARLGILDDEGTV